MTAVPSIDPARFLTEQLSQASPDLMRDLLTTFRQRAALRPGRRGVWRRLRRTHAGAGQLPQRYRHRDLDTRVGTLDVAVPKLRTGSLYPEWLLERRKRAERALTSVVRPATCSGSVPAGSTGRAVHVRGSRRARAQGPRGWPGGAGARAGCDRGQRRRTPGDPGRAGHLQ
jgi:hypothetical protein